MRPVTPVVPLRRAGRPPTLAGGVLSADGARLLGVALRNNENPIHWLENGMQEIRASVDAALRGRRNIVVSSSLDEMVLIIHSSTPGAPGRYMILNRRSHSLSPLGPVHPQVTAAMLGRVEPVRIKAHDGFVLRAVLTLPLPKPAKPCPLVLVIPDPLHGTSADAAYDPVSRYLAARGYVVLKVNVRGTAGFGRAYEEAGRHEFTTKMPSDLSDAARWAVAAGFADSKRIALFGRNGSATLALIAATQRPQLYHCVINDDGNADLTKFADEQFRYEADGARAALLVLGDNGTTEFVRSSTPFQGLENANAVQAVTGFPRRDTADWLTPERGSLSAASPDRALADLQAALLNIYDAWGAKDQDWIQYDLKRAHKPYTTFHELPPADIHTNAEVRLNYYRQIDAFLAQHL